VYVNFDHTPADICGLRITKAMKSKVAGSVAHLQDTCLLAAASYFAGRWAIGGLSRNGQSQTVNVVQVVSYAMAQLVEALRYKPEGHGLFSCWVYWHLSLT
jgi:hypothetical protein